MVSIVNASPTNGITVTSDGSGVLKCQANGVTTNALAWVNFNGSTSAIRANYNIGSITKNATGDFTLNFTSALADANYSVSGICSDLTYGANIYLEGTTYSTTAVRILTRSGYTATPATGDATYTCIQVHGN